VSTGPPNMTVPSIVNMPWAQAEPLLKQGGWLYNNPPNYQYDETRQAGLVIDVQPEMGKSVPPDTPLVVTVSKGHAPVKVLDVSGMTYDDAKSALEALHFKVAPEQDDFDATVPKGKVIRTDPAAESLQPYGATITVHVSKGPDLVVVPDLKGDTLTQAADELHKAGLAVGTTAGWQTDTDTVVSQSPRKNQKIKRGDSVDLTFAGRGIICSILGTC
jgi:beta-lactam-binding protein with PASTA domain